MARKPIRELFAELRERFGGKCQDCGSEDDLEFAHKTETGVNGRGRGQSRRYYDVKNNEDAYELLCRPCHVARDFDGVDPWVKGRPRIARKKGAKSI